MRLTGFHMRIKRVALIWKQSVESNCKMLLFSKSFKTRLFGCIGMKRSCYSCYKTTKILQYLQIYNDFRLVCICMISKVSHDLIFRILIDSYALNHSTPEYLLHSKQKSSKNWYEEFWPVLYQYKIMKT